jgi:type II secretory pathway pseudopilin PulG
MMIPPNQKFGFTLAKQRDPESIRGFTLAELLIATGVTVIIVVLLGTMLGSVLNTASRTNQRIDAFRDARAALQMIERDLSNLVRAQWNPDPFPSPVPQPCAASTTSTTSVTRPAAYFALKNIYADPAAGNQQIFGLVALNANGSPTPSAGDVCAVGYYCRWEGNRYTLRRFFRDSTHTFTVLQNAGSYAADSALYDLNAADARNDLIAAYVWNFTVVVYDSNGNRYTTYPCVCDQSATTPTLLPAAIEISFNAMSPQAARTVMSVSSSPADWMTMNVMNANLVNPHTYQFRTRINFQ